MIDLLTTNSFKCCWKTLER